MPRSAMTLRNGLKTAIVLAMVSGLLSGCDTASERAEAHFQSALALAAAGDFDRAFVEFRNVFKLDGTHREARSAYAAIQRERGNLNEAIGQYLRLVEQYPDDMNANRALAEMQAEIGNWPELGRFVEAVLVLDPQDAVGRALHVVDDYQKAISAEDAVAASAAATEAAALRPEMPDYVILRQVVIDDLVRRGVYDEAIAELDAAIALAPGNQALYSVRLSVLAAMGDSIAVEEQLLALIALFPQDNSYRGTLIRWYISQDRLSDAEAFLRHSVETDADDTAARMTLLNFLTEFKGEDVALAELDGMIAAGQNETIYQSLRAGLLFALGDRDVAIAQLKTLVENALPSDEIRNIKVGLAQMLDETGDKEGARGLIDAVLAEDRNHVEALKALGASLIDADQVGEAIVALRNALDMEPRDADILTLLARAHEREGNVDLSGEMLALAVQASNAAPDESLRYAAFLTHLGKIDTVSTVLIDSLRLDPSNVDVLTQLGRIYLLTRDWPRGTQIIRALRALESDAAVYNANILQAQILQAQERDGEAVAFLEGLVNDGDAGLDASLAIVRTLLAAGDLDAARRHVEGLRVKDPDDPGVRFLAASVDTVSDNTDRARQTYESLVADYPDVAQFWIALCKLLLTEGELAAAHESVDRALATLPQDDTLRWIKASILEQSGDLPGAIGIYEAMYAENSDNMIVANNLASLLTAVDTGPEAVNRAYVIARRLRGSTVPAYNDTYGWIAHLRGDLDEAVPALEVAARGLPEDPAVQAHLALAYVVARRDADALPILKKVVALSAGGEFADQARAEIERIEAGAPAVSE